jgi:hypothetical protein
MKKALLSLAALALLAPLAPAQGDAQAKKAAEPLPAGERKTFKAVVIQVEGLAQARAKPDAAWANVKVNDLLDPGAVIRTGRNSQVTLRLGQNATLLVDRQSRVAIPEIAQDGDVLRTRVAMNFGKADVRVDRIGLVNDFEVSTPTATLAVRGTTFRIWWDVVNGFRSMGVEANKLRAIEITYLERVEAWLSKADGSSEEYALPALDAFYETYLKPLKGAVDESESPDADQSQLPLKDVKRDTGVEAANKQRGFEGQQRTGNPNDNPNNPGAPQQPPPTGKK